MSAEEDVFEKLDALLRKHHPGAFNAPAANTTIERSAQKEVVVPVLTDIATPSIMALTPEQQAEIPVLTEVIHLALAARGDADVVDLDQEFERDLKLAVTLPEDANPTTGLGTEELLESSELHDESDFEQEAIGPGIEVPPVTLEAEIPTAPPVTPPVEEIIELTPIIETPPVELIAPEPEDLLFTEYTPIESIAPPEAAPIAEEDEAPIAAAFNNDDDYIEPAPIELLARDAHSPPEEITESVKETPSAPHRDAHLPLIDALDADEEVLIFDEMDMEGAPEEASPAAAEFALKDLDEHLLRLVEEKLGPQLTATMDRALANMLDQFSTHIEYLVRESVALELQKQLEALRHTFAQQLSAQRAKLDQAPEKDQ